MRSTKQAMGTIGAVGFLLGAAGCSSDAQTSPASVATIPNPAASAPAKGSRPTLLTFEGSVDVGAHRMNLTLRDPATGAVRTQEIPYGLGADHAMLHTEAGSTFFDSGSGGACNAQSNVPHVCGEVELTNGFGLPLVGATAVLDAVAPSEVTPEGPFVYPSVPGNSTSAALQWVFDDPGGVNFYFRGHLEGSLLVRPDGPTQAFQMCTDGTFLYIPRGTSVYRAALDGSSVAVWATAISGTFITASRCAIDATTLYVTDGAPGNVIAISLADSTVQTTLLSGLTNDPYAIAVDDTSIYVGANDEASFLMKASKKKPGPTTPLVATGGVLDVKVVGSTVIYVVPFSGTTGVGWIQNDGTQPMFFPGQPTIGIDTDGTNVYWDDIAFGIRAAPLATGVASTLTTTLLGGNGIVYADGNVYFWDGFTNGIVGVSTTTGLLTTLGSGGGGTQAEYPLVSGQFVYWADVNGSAIFATPR